MYLPSADGGRAHKEAEDKPQEEASGQYLEGVADSMHADGGRAHEEAEDKPQVEAGCEAASQTGEQVGNYKGDNNPQPAISVSQQS